MEVSVGKMTPAQGTIANMVIFTMVAGVNDQREPHPALHRDSARREYKSAPEWTAVKHPTLSTPMSSSSQPALSGAPREGGTTGGDRTETDAEITSSGQLELE